MHTSVIRKACARFPGSELRPLSSIGCIRGLRGLRRLRGLLFFCPAFSSFSSFNLRPNHAKSVKSVVQFEKESEKQWNCYWNPITTGYQKHAKVVKSVVLFERSSLLGDFDGPILITKMKKLDFSTIFGQFIITFRTHKKILLWIFTFTKKAGSRFWQGTWFPSLFWILLYTFGFFASWISIMIFTFFNIFAILGSPFLAFRTRDQMLLVISIFV